MNDDRPLKGYVSYKKTVYPKEGGQERLEFSVEFWLDKGDHGKEFAKLKRKVNDELLIMNLEEHCR